MQRVLKKNPKYSFEQSAKKISQKPDANQKKLATKV
jgi:hypothetical protein